ncbi:hypothetical protein CONPUDRAFT_161683 [Coniophora puteana RWD-64-598 SS2]|uniref:Uncharacterized protein n=1 Tax=Coniophora puteana (strain RWD-64-598) TaxID=741705 RepID=A0A5M3N6K6_CONPW|nr:uncharacterized protein CONPUDRAFT_161683 [Coniophora puteana RWD-64-598 SS2]EIW87069.1 hypothetical protein CONPUDRAFT_161683 [Coniophora puteana RWD-64-598 SS2]
MAAESQSIYLTTTPDPCRTPRQSIHHEPPTKTLSDTIVSPLPVPTITIMPEHATTPEPINLMPPEDDPFSPQYVPKHTLKRRSSRLSHWLEQLQTQASSPQQGDGEITPKPARRTCGPYLAYPHLSHRTALPTFDEDSDGTYDYVLIEDADIEDYPAIEHSDEPISHDVLTASSEYMTPRSGVRKLKAPASLRNLYLAARPPSTSMTSTPPHQSRLSMLSRPTRVTSGPSNDDLSHIRSSSAVSSHLEVPSTTSKRWRPSVLGHFSPSQSDSRLPHDPSMNPSRPSISSTNTSSLTIPTSSTMYEENPPSQTPQKSITLLGSLRRRHSEKPSKADRNSSASPSLWLGSSSPQQEPDGPQSPSRLVRKASTIRLPFTSKAKPPQTGYAGTIFEEIGSPQPRTVYAGRSGGRISLSSIGPPSRTKKKKLVVSGIGMKDTRRLEAVQRWCQSFGEVDEIVRMPNGDLHVNFHRAEVADTVCRVRAKVFIPGVGSVHLSWYTGNKRP